MRTLSPSDFLHEACAGFERDFGYRPRRILLSATAYGMLHRESAPHCLWEVPLTGTRFEGIRVDVDTDRFFNLAQRFEVALS